MCSCQESRLGDGIPNSTARKTGRRPGIDVPRFSGAEPGNRSLEVGFRACDLRFFSEKGGTPLWGSAVSAGPADGRSVAWGSRNRRAAAALARWAIPAAGVLDHQRRPRGHPNAVRRANDRGGVRPVRLFRCERKGRGRHDRRRPDDVLAGVERRGGRRRRRDEHPRQRDGTAGGGRPMRGANHCSHACSISSTRWRISASLASTPDFIC